MPERSYMVVDRRHDHSFRIPRPDLSAKLGTPNACNECHRDKSAEWATSTIETWFGPRREGFQTYAAAFHAAWTQQPDAGKLLNEVVSDSNAPAVARASALIELGGYISPPISGWHKKPCHDSDPMVPGRARNARQPAGRHFASSVDPIRGVRIRALALLAADSTASQPRRTGNVSIRPRRLLPGNVSMRIGLKRE
jgi:hypothetical protein